MLVSENNFRPFAPANSGVTSISVSKLIRMQLAVKKNFFMFIFTKIIVTLDRAGTEI
jgi:hypothetical protein